MELGQTALVLEENVRRSSELGQAEEGAFSRELRRMREFDEEVCPEDMRDALDYLKEHGWNTAELFSRFGKKEWRFPISDLEIYAALLNKFYRTERNSSLSLSEFDRDHKFRIMLPVTEHRPQREDKAYFREDRLIELGDRIRGFSKIYADHRHEETPSRETKRLRIMGLLREYCHYLDLGDISIEKIDPIGVRRFTYAFGIPPVSFEEIKQALVKTNRFPEEGTKVESGRYKVCYELKQVDFKELKNPPRAAKLWHDEALVAKEKGLFSDVQAYELLNDLKPIDPVIVGFDAFGNKYPIVYWGGDKGLGRGDKRMDN
jgi:hypothetical protein